MRENIWDFMKTLGAVIALIIVFAGGIRLIIDCNKGDKASCDLLDAMADD